MDSKRETVSDNNEMIGHFMGVEWNTYEKLRRTYEYNWNELMPVVKKISEMNEEMEIDLPITASIDQVYDAVVEFIKWYNSQSPDTIKP